MKAEIKQNGKVVLSSDDDVSIPMIFHNLSGRNLSGREYREYLEMACRNAGMASGTVELYLDGILTETATIPEI